MKNKIFRSHDSSQNQKFQLFQHEKVSSTGDIFSQNLHQDDRTTTNQSEQKPTMAELFEELGVTFFIDDAEVSHSQKNLLRHHKQILLQYKIKSAIVQHTQMLPILIKIITQ